MSQLAPIDLDTELAHAQWPNPTLREQFYKDVAEQGTTIEIDTIKQWVWLIGKPSQFLGYKVWTVAQCVDHFQQLGEWQAREESGPALEPALPRAPLTEEQQAAKDVFDAAAKVQRELKNAAIAKASEDWHKAVEERRVAVKTSRDWTKAECDRLKAAHVTLEKRWVEYSESKRAALKSLLAD